jgi:hypothetical protein
MDEQCANQARKEVRISCRAACQAGAKPPSKPMIIAKTTAASATPQVRCRLKTVSLKVRELPIPVLMPLKGKIKDDPDNGAQQRKQQRFDHERGENAGAGKSYDAQGCDFAGAIGDGGVHRIHGGETGADGHDDGDESADKFDRLRRNWSASRSIRFRACLRASGADRR